MAFFIRLPLRLRTRKGKRMRLANNRDLTRRRLARFLHAGGFAGCIGHIVACHGVCRLLHFD